MPGLDEAEATFIDEMVEAMVAGTGGDKRAVATEQAAAIKKFVKAGVIKTINDILKLTAGGYSVVGQSTGDGSMN
ncbi:hypothetical protein KJ966_06640 [bacterium]|nr:hypothetical protein [bacterium]